MWETHCQQENIHKKNAFLPYFMCAIFLHAFPLSTPHTLRELVNSSVIHIL